MTKLFSSFDVSSLEMLCGRKERGEVTMKDGDKMRSETTECVVTTSISRQEYWLSCYTHAQARYVFWYPWNTRPKKRHSLLPKISFRFLCAYGSSWWLYVFLFTYVCIWQKSIKTWTVRVATFLTHTSSQIPWQSAFWGSPQNIWTCNFKHCDVHGG